MSTVCRRAVHGFWRRRDGGLGLLEDRHPRCARLGVVADRRARRQDHALHVELHRPHRRPPAAAHQQRRQVEHLRRHLHARQPAVPLRRHRTRPATRRPASSSSRWASSTRTATAFAIPTTTTTITPAPARAGALAVLARRPTPAVTAGERCGTQPPAGYCDSRCCARLCDGPLLQTAHHSHGNYTDTFIDLQGIAQGSAPAEPTFVGLHGRAQSQRSAADVGRRGDGQIGLERIGVTADTVKPGETVKVRCHPLRDGSRGCLLGFLKTKDGEVKDGTATGCRSRRISDQRGNAKCKIQDANREGQTRELFRVQIVTDISKDAVAPEKRGYLFRAPQHGRDVSG